MGLKIYFQMAIKTKEVKITPSRKTSELILPTSTGTSREKKLSKHKESNPHLMGSPNAWNLGNSFITSNSEIKPTNPSDAENDALLKKNNV